jgi:hypothetical protein
LQSSDEASSAPSPPKEKDGSLAHDGSSGISQALSPMIDRMMMADLINMPTTQL